MEVVLGAIIRTLCQDLWAWGQSRSFLWGAQTQKERRRRAKLSSDRDWPSKAEGGSARPTRRAGTIGFMALCPVEPHPIKNRPFDTLFRLKGLQGRSLLHRKSDALWCPNLTSSGAVPVLVDQFHTNEVG